MIAVSFASEEEQDKKLINLFEATVVSLASHACRKFNVSVDFNAYKEWRERNGVGAPNGPASHTYDVRNDETMHGEALPGIAPFSLNASGNAVGGGRGLGGGSSGGGDGINSIDGSSDAVTTAAAAPYPTSFAHVVELITSGKPIPGIKEIPDTVLVGQETKSNHEKRKKPWEN